MALFTSNGTALFDARVLAYLARPTTHGNPVNTGTILLGFEQYLDLVRRAVELRSRIHGDVSLTNYDDDGAYVSLTFRIDTVETNLRQAYDEVRRVADEIEETARQAGDEIGQRLVIAARLSGWGSQSLDVLVDAVGTAKQRTRKAALLRNLAAGYSRQCMV